MHSPLTHQPRMLLTRRLPSGGIDNMCLHERECAATQADLPSITDLHTQKAFHTISMQHCSFKISVANLAGVHISRLGLLLLWKLSNGSSQHLG